MLLIFNRITNKLLNIEFDRKIKAYYDYGYFSIIQDYGYYDYHNLNNIYVVYTVFHYSNLQLLIIILFILLVFIVNCIYLLIKNNLTVLI